MKSFNQTVSGLLTRSAVIWGRKFNEATSMDGGGLTESMNGTKFTGQVHGPAIVQPGKAGEQDAGMVDFSDRRKHPREKVLKAAKIIHGGGNSVFNCVVLDESPDGVFVDMGAIMMVPTDVTIQFSTGATFRATKRWTNGTKIGFQFDGPQIISHETARRMQTVGQILNDHGLEAAMQTLRVAQFFDNLDLRRNAETAEAAYRQFKDALSGGNLF